jgi:hypothetical protein
MVPWFYLAGTAACAGICLALYVWEILRYKKASSYILMLEFEFRMQSQHSAMYSRIEEAHKDLVEIMKEEVSRSRI